MNQKKKGTRLSEDWMPPYGCIEWAVKNFPNLDITTETECFVDYWVAKPSNATKLDWDRTWKSWMRRAAKRTAPRGGKRRSAAEDNWSVVQKYERAAIHG